MGLIRPYIEIIREDKPQAAEMISYFDRQVYADPYSYLAAIRKLGGHSLGFCDVYPEHLRDTRPEATVRHLFEEGYDQIIGFDETTEDKLTADRRHQEFMASLRKQKSIDSHEGTMKVVRRENPYAASARDAVRWSRLYHYVNSMVTWQEADQPDLKSAS